MPFPLLFAWFANPLMLWGLGAASLPIIIHLLNRRRFREMRWAATRFLLAAIRKNQRRVRLEQWLLLAIRTLLVILVASAMARPFLESLGAVPLLQGGRTHWVVVLDGSLSMDQTAGDASRFEQAKSLADGLVKSSRQGDLFSVLLMADPPRVVIGAPAPQRDVVRREIRETTPTHGAVNLRATFDKIDEVLAASDVPRKEVVFVTDLQRTSWAQTSPDASEGLKKALAKLNARKPRSWVIDLGSDAAENRAVTDLTVTPSVLTPGASAAVRAVVKNFGRRAADGLHVRLIADGRIGPEQTISLEPGEEQAVAFIQEFPSPGDHLIEIQIDDDALKPDNARRRSIPVREAVRVLLVDGDPKGERFKSETDYLAVALSPEPEPGGPPSPVRPEVVSESGLSGRDLSPYDAVVLCNVGRVTENEVAALEAYLKSGGGLVVFGGDRVAADNYNRLLYAGGKGILPAELGPVVGDARGRERPFEFDALGFKHPLVAPFAGATAPITAGLTQVKTARFHKLVLPKTSSAKVALAFSNGDPAIVEAVRGRGRVFLVATSADTDWTSWPLHHGYPPVMEQMIMTAASGRSAERNVLVGRPLEQSYPGSATGAAAVVRRPAGASGNVKLVADGELSLLRYEDSDLSGPYRAQVGPPVNAEAVFAVNTDPAESDPAKLDAASLRAAVPGWEFLYDNNWRPLRENAASVGHRGELHRPLLWGVLALLLIESLLAWRFGHHNPRS